ncbi:MAG: zinc ABC transporter substrate-binding protein [Gammaproteobacteria bacterium]|nr:zinc ABC transporter substrate-binding protein [Gammaproteobacteria bacterium]
MLPAMLAVAACDRDSRSAAEKPGVVVSIPPQAFIIDKLVGGLVEVRTMVPAGRSPEGYQPLPQQLAGIKNSSHYFAIGLPFEQVWLPRLVQAHKSIEVVAPPAGELKDDPHRWTDPRQMIEFAWVAYRTMQPIYPGDAEVLSDNFLQLKEELNELDKKIAALMMGQEKRRFLVFHPAWSYFAKRYGLEQVAYEHDGQQPGARYMTDLLDLCRQNNVRTLFVQPQSSAIHAERFADELNLSQVVIDPLDYNYIGNLEKVAGKIAGDLW